MSHSIYERNGVEPEFYISHSDFDELKSDAMSLGSLGKAVKAYDIDENALEHSITNIGYFYPDARAVTKEPTFINRDQEWVQKVLGRVHKSPFAKTKSWHANLTADAARAKGYVKGNQKVEEVIVALKRTTEPQTVYKLQKLDRDDVIDITDFSIVNWIKGEMRTMLNEEVARAILVGDGREALDADKIKPDRIRPIWGDSDIYVINKAVEYAATDTPSMKAEKYLEAALRARKDYKGSGNLVQYTTEDFLVESLLIKDGVGRRIYNNEEDVNKFIRVKETVTVPIMEGLYRTVDGVRHDLITILVNLSDYTVGTDKGGEVNLFDDFDIDFNKYEYLIETRMSGAMTTPYGAIVIEAVAAATE